MRTHLLILLAIGFAALGGVGAARQADTYRPTATIKDIMKAMVDPSADYIWETMATRLTATAILDNTPKNEKEWTRLRNQTIVLIESTNLLAMPGRHVARPGEKSENPGIELDPEQIEILVNNNRTSFVNLSHSLHDVATQLLTAVDAKDTQGVLRAADALDVACENCHKQFWYPAPLAPQQPRP
jgi:cytochrome c556